MNLVYKHEKKLFIIAALISALFWLLLIVGTMGFALIYIAFIALFSLFAHSGFIAYLKGTGVKITAEQYPDLYQKMTNNCQKLQVDTIPEFYLLRTDFFNALATKFLGRHFVVLFSDVVDALEEQPGALDFYIGHELGHIHRKHLAKMAFLLPAMFLPLLGAALRRSEEYTCDRYGAFCCESSEDIQAAIAAISAGDSRWKDFNVIAYQRQIDETSGFWMSFNELISDYPWMTKRMATALSFKQGEERKHPRRSVLAWILACFIPRTGMGAAGLGPMLVMISIIGILAATAIPAYQDYTKRTMYAEVLRKMRGHTSEVMDYYREYGRLPNKGQLQIVQEFEILKTPVLIQGEDKGGILAFVGDGEHYMELVPHVGTDSHEVEWSCHATAIPVRQLPTLCR